MKRAILTLLVTIIFFLGNTSTNSAPSFSDLGQWTGETKHLGWFVTATGAYYITLVGYQFGIQIKGFPGGDIYYLYGQGDLPWWTKSAAEIDNDETNNDNLKDNYIVSIIEISNINNPEVIKSIEVSDLNYNNNENILLNLENNKNYIIISRNNKGNIVDIKKIYKSN